MPDDDGLLSYGLGRGKVTAVRCYGVARAVTSRDTTVTMAQ